MPRALSRGRPRGPAGTPRRACSSSLAQHLLSDRQRVAGATPDAQAYAPETRQASRPAPGSPSRVCFAIFWCLLKAQDIVSQSIVSLAK